MATVVQSGVTIVRTVTSTPTLSPVAGSQSGSSTKSSGTSPGIIAAAVVASVLGLLVLAVGAYFLWRRRRRDEQNEKFGGLNDDPSPSNLNRNASTHSKARLLERHHPPTISTTRVSQGRDNSSSSDAVSPVTPKSDQRHSRQMMYDQRLNPVMVLDNGSRTSVATLEDHRDYGRMLKVSDVFVGRASA